MVDFEVKPDGEIDDRVRVVFKGFEVRIFENYGVKMAVLQQPNAFSVRLGGLEQPKELFARYPAGTPFQLAIGPCLAFTGDTDGYESSGDGGGTTVILAGRDQLAKLVDAEFGADKSFVNVTYAELVAAVMDEVGGIDGDILADNDANVRIRAGQGVTKKPGTPGTPPQAGGGATPAGGPPAGRGAGVLTERGGRNTVETEKNKDITPTRTRDVPKAADPALLGTPGTRAVYTVHAKMGDKCLEFLHRHLDKGGLMLWTGANGDIVISAPNILQPPTYKFVRQRGQLRNEVNVLSHKFKNDTTKRASKVVVYARGPGKKAGKGKIRGEFVDEEMVRMGITRTRSFRDVNVQDEAQAVKYARAKMAEINRSSWHLTYTIKGHTAPLVSGKGRAVITPDTVAEITDDELGLSGLYYVEAVEYSAPPTITSITFMRLADCFFEKDPTIVEQVESANKGRKRRRRRKS